MEDYFKEQKKDNNLLAIKAKKKELVGCSGKE